MATKVATTCFQWSQPIVNKCTSSSSPTRQSRRGNAGVMIFRYSPRLGSSNLFGSSLTLQRSRSCGYTKSRTQTTKRACSASLDAFSDEEFSKQIKELAIRFQLSDDDQDLDSESMLIPDFVENNFRNESSQINSSVNFVENHRSPFQNQVEASWPEMPQEPPEWPSRDEIIPASIERKANSVDLPLSLRIIKKKMQWEEGIREAGESACCSVKKAFSSMVLIIRELQSFTLQMRESLCFEDLQGILARVQTELHASFVWLFQQVFSHTPTLMVYVMILLANFTVHSMACNAAIAAPPPFRPIATESVSTTTEHRNLKFDISSISSFSELTGKAASIGGSNGGGGNSRLVSGGTDGEERHVISNQEVALWNSILEEVSDLQASSRDESLNHDVVRRFVSPVTVKIESDGYGEYIKTELEYQRGLSQEPNNSLLLANYAQFLYLVAHDYDRAEEYFKKAIKVEPPDAEALGKYATFLWKARNETWAAEETYLEAINADPGNTYYAGNYADFLWNTGGDDTCYPLNDHDV